MLKEDTTMSEKTVAKKPITPKEIANWVLDHAMILIIVLLAIYVQIMRPTVFGVGSL